MDKLLTITIPAYNAQDFLGECLDSLLAEGKRTETELLVIDDGSTDQTGGIAESYARRYPEIVRVFHKENGGHGSAINLGIKAAKGKYFRVVDSDDTVDPEAYVAYLEKLKEIESDLIVTPFVCVTGKVQRKKMETAAAGFGKYGKDKRLQRNGKRKEKFRPVEGAKELPHERPLLFETAAKKLYVRMHEWTIRTSILQEHGIQLSEHSFYVDMQYITFPVPWICTCCILDMPVYRYRLGGEGQSVSVRNMQKNRRQHQKVLRSLVKFYKEREKAGDSQNCLAYLANSIAKMQANQVQIALSLPVGRAAKKELCKAEKWLKKECPAGYAANQKKSLWLLRASGYLLYPAGAAAWRIIKR